MVNTIKRWDGTQWVAIYDKSTFVLHNGTVSMTGDLTLYRDPQSVSHAVNKNYADNLVLSHSWKRHVNVATIENITLSGAQTIDGIPIIAGSRVLVKDQTTDTQNGIYDVFAGPWIRAWDGDSVADLLGATVMVSQGDTNKDTVWMLTTDPPIALGATPLQWTQIAGDGKYVKRTGDTMTAGQLHIASTSGEKIKFSGANSQYIAGYTFTTTPSARIGYLQFIDQAGSGPPQIVRLVADAGNELQLYGGSNIRLSIGPTGILALTSTVQKHCFGQFRIGVTGASLVLCTDTAGDTQSWIAFYLDAGGPYDPLPPRSAYIGFPTASSYAMYVRNEATGGTLNLGAIDGSTTVFAGANNLTMNGGGGASIVANLAISMTAAAASNITLNSGTSGDINLNAGTTGVVAIKGGTTSGNVSVTTASTGDISLNAGTTGTIYIRGGTTSGGITLDTAGVSGINLNGGGGAVISTNASITLTAAAASNVTLNSGTSGDVAINAGTSGTVTIKGGTTSGAITLDTAGTGDIILSAGSTGGISLTAGTTSGNITLDAGGPGNISLLAGSSGALIFTTGATERARFDSAGNFLVSKTASSVNTQGIELLQTGSVNATRADTGAPIVSNMTDSTTSGIPFYECKLNNTRIGYAHRTGTTSAVTWATSSDKNWKTNIIDLDDDEAIVRVEKWRPIAFQWKQDERGNPTELGEASGPVIHGFIAQELYEVQPNAVTPGYGTEEEHREWMENPEGNDPFSPWMSDNSSLVPDLTAAVQALIRQVKSLKEEVVTLKKN